jgi:hypothetical protein
MGGVSHGHVGTSRSSPWTKPRLGRLGDADCWVVVITGSGDKAFSAGMDLKAFARGEGAEIMGASGGFAGLTSAPIPQADHRRRQRFRLAGGSRSCSRATSSWRPTMPCSASPRPSGA